MRSVILANDSTIDAFKSVTRSLLADSIAPADVLFVSPDEISLFATTASPSMPSFKIPRSYATLLADAICHTATDRFALLYELLWRIHHGEPAVTECPSDPAVAKLMRYAKAVRRDIHKMHAFVRFKEVRTGGEVVFIAWFEPQFHILRRAAPFFRDRFSQMHWLIATPSGTAEGRDDALVYGAPVARPADVGDPVLEDIWRTYYQTTFNPARVRIKTMTAEMPKRFWHNMPEAALIPEMIKKAEPRVEAMDHEPQPAPLFAQRIAARRLEDVMENAICKDALPLNVLRKEASLCTRCSLYEHATQTVFGEGPADAHLVFVGEQPGDQEDLAGKPFVGPAGELFNRALADAGIDRARVYVTNAVKHFKFEPRGRRRIHKKPNAGETKACRWWLNREIQTVSPRLIVALGATAAMSLAGRPVSVLQERGRATRFGERAGLITVHPSYLLRLPDKAAAQREFTLFVADLRIAAKQCERLVTNEG
jgi:probable DNA metabolism protein